MCGQGVYEKSLYFPLYFAVKKKKIKSEKEKEGEERGKI